MSKRKELRIAAGLTRAQLAAAAGVNVRTLEAYEQGIRETSKMALDVALRIAEALKCSPADLI